MNAAKKTAAEMTTAELLNVMNHGFIRSEIAAANKEYFRRVEAGEHKRPAPVAVLGAQDSDQSWHKEQMKALS